MAERDYAAGLSAPMPAAPPPVNEDDWAARLGRIWRFLPNPGGYAAEVLTAPVQATAEAMAAPFQQGGQALGGNPSAIGLYAEGQQPDFYASGERPGYETGVIDPGVMVPWATEMAGMAETGGMGLSRPVANATGTNMRTTLYHGSQTPGIDVLNPSDRGPLGPGVYTSPARQISEGYYAGPEGTVYELPVRDRDIYMGHGHRTDEEWAGFKEDKKRLVEAAAPDDQSKVEAILEKMWSSDGYPTYQRILRDVYKGDEAAAQGLFQRAGFEGVSGLVDGPEVLLFGEQSLRP